LCFRHHFCGYVREGEEENVADSNHTSAHDDHVDNIKGTHCIRLT
jgi:hypothetical protein